MSTLPYYRSASMTPEWLSNSEADSRSMHHVAPFHLVDQQGTPISDMSLQGHVTVAHFFFTRCGDVCPTTTRNLGRLLREFADDSTFQILSYSITPESDSVAQLHSYAQSHGITDSRWHLLTGNADDVFRLARGSYFVRLGDGATYGVASIAHTESVLLVDDCGRLRGVYAGTLALEIDRLREDALVLEHERCRPAS